MNNVRQHESGFTCDFCDHESISNCAEESSNGYTCTLPKGHDGAHVACGYCSNHHPIETWCGEPTTLIDPAHPEIGERLMDAAQAHALACIELGKSKADTLKEGHAIYDRAVNGLEFKS